MVLRVAPPRVEPALPAPVAAAVRERVVGAPARARAGAPPERARASAEPAPHAPPIVPAPDAARVAPIIRAPVERTIVAIAPDDAIATPEQYRVALAFAARRLQPPPGDGDALDAAVRATVRITFTPLGRLDDVSLVASSGSAALDAAAIALGSAVHAALPLPPRLHGRVASVDLTVAAARAAASAAGP
jgi:TonB family protein